MSAYVEERADGYWIANSRIALDSIAIAFLDGEAAESIAQAFPVLTLEQVYGAIAFYLAHRDQIDAYLAVRQADFERARLAARQRDPLFYQKLAGARRTLKVAAE